MTIERMLKAVIGHCTAKWVLPLGRQQVGGIGRLMYLDFIIREKDIEIWKYAHLGLVSPIPHFMPKSDLCISKLLQLDGLDKHCATPYPSPFQNSRHFRFSVFLMIVQCQVYNDIRQDVGLLDEPNYGYLHDVFRFRRRLKHL